MLTVIFPCCNEENYIGKCLESVLAQECLPDDHGIQIVIAANGCRDRTVDICRGYEPSLEAKGYSCKILDIPTPGKINALNCAERAARFETRIFVDADIVLGPRILSELSSILQSDEPTYASGTVVIPRSKSWATRAYARVWSSLPFVRDGVPGIGVYAVNRSGRARWGKFPTIYSDDRFVRLNFATEERKKAEEIYYWPLPDGLWNLIRVRARWCEGNRELVNLYPDLISNDGERNKSAVNLFTLLRTPASAIVFVLVFAVGEAWGRMGWKNGGFYWRRGRT